MAQFQKHPTEVVVVGMDFGPRMPAGTTISSCAASRTTGDVTVGTATFLGTVVSSTLSGGTDGVNSVVEFRANLNDSEVLISSLDVPVSVRA